MLKESRMKLDDGKMIGSIFIDISKAFHTVHHANW